MPMENVLNVKDIVERENNNNSYVHLYCIPIIDMWVSFGYSAYLLRLYANDCEYDNIVGFSDIELPCTMISSSIVKKLRGNVLIQKEQEDYLLLSFNRKADYHKYSCWVTNLKEEKILKEMKIQTNVSHLVPKDCFIPDSMSAFARIVKRMIAMFALLFFSPLALCCFILIKLEDGGPAIFKQERIGRFGRPFYIYKFRSMKMDAEKHGPQLSHKGGENDIRLTKIGAFLRAHHLDELPQLWNVFIGDMSFVGPRPERKFYIDQILDYDKRYTYLYQIRPGVTSFATLYNGYTDTMEKMLCRLEYDLYYLMKRSWWFDLKILWNTFCSIVLGKKF